MKRIKKAIKFIKKYAIPLPYKKTIWMLFDMSNSNAFAKNYCWWFPTEKLALEFMKDHETRTHASDLVGPVRAKVSVKECVKLLENHYETIKF